MKDYRHVQGEVSLVLNYKRPSFWIIIIAVVGLAVCVGLMTNNKSNILTQKEFLQPIAPEWSPKQTVGVDMVQLDYASDDIVIFHDYFGLFVYDLNTLQLIHSLDLKPLNCHQTQGDNYCDISVSIDGTTVQLHPMSSENMVVYTVSSHTLQESTYQQMEERFSNRFVPIEDVIDSSILGNYSHSAVRFDTGEYGYLYTSDGTIGELTYVRGDKTYTLFNSDKN